MILAEIKEVIKASPAIQIESKITHLQRRAWNVLLANAYNELPTVEVHRVNVVELANKLGFNSKKLDYLKETLEALVDCKVRWNLLNKDNQEKWGVASLLSEVEIENGVCTYAFTPYLRYKLYNPRIYARLNLQMQDRFTSRYALIVWEVCFDYFDIARHQGETPFIPLETFRELVGLEKDRYNTFKELNRNVIKPAIKEINELTGYFVEVEHKRLGRKVGELKFRITKRKHLSGEPTAQETVFADTYDLPEIARELVEAGVSRREALRIAVQEWDAVDADALPETENLDFAMYVAEKIQIAAHAENVSNPGGFITQAIRENYLDPLLAEELHQKQLQEHQAMLEVLKADFNERKNALLQQAVREEPHLLERAAEKITSRFVRACLETYSSAADAYKVGGMVTAEINYILAEELCQDLLAPVLQQYEDEKARIEQKYPTRKTPKKGDTA